MDKTWILIANGERARCFERRPKDHALIELADFIHPEIHLASSTAQGDISGDAGKGHGRTGHAGTQFEPHTEAHAKERRTFAHQLADYLNRGVADNQYNSLVLFASSAMLGALRPLLGSATMKALQTSVTTDLTSYEGADLRERVNRALRLAD